MIIKIISVLFINFYVLITLIKCDTILFTNSPNHLVNNNNNNNKNFTSYKLDVPGSTNSITIIEANTRKPILTRKQDDIDSRNLLSNNMLNVQIPDNDKKTVFAPSLLEKFINEYNIKISSHLTPSSDTIERSQIKRYDTYSDEIDKYENENQNQYQNYQQQPHQRPYQSDRKNPFNQKEGWVTLQAVPWSKSQVAKWKPKADVRPIHSVSGLNIYRDDSSLDSLIYQKDNKYPGEQMLDEQKKTNQYPKRPSFYDGEKDYELATNRRPIIGDSWKNGAPVRKKPTEKPQIEVASDRWYDYGFKSDLEDIYKKPSLDSVYNDPEDQQSPQNYADSVMFDDQNYQTSMKRSPIRRPEPYKNSNSDNSYPSQKYQNRHPSNHPASGNGQWVLVSTTKGYQHPKPTHSVPRRMNFDSTSNISLFQVPTNFRAHKSIKLTVLPAKSKNGKLKPMSLSHGGLIEVESSSHTVEDSAANSIKRKVKRKASLPENNEVQFIEVPYRNTDNKPAVLAAVSAGMVPATMAMLMPMMLGRKKRSLSEDNSLNLTVTHYLKRL